MPGVTKHHNESHRLRPLTQQQYNALDLLIAGRSDREAAEQVGVERETVTRWRLYNPAFQAGLNRRREEIWGSCIDRMRSLLLKALEATEEVLADGGNPSRAKVALELVKAAVLHSQSGSSFKVSGPQEPELIVDEIARRREKESLLIDLGGGPILDSQRSAIVRELESKLGEPLEETVVAEAKKEGA